jgi:hypothetical protein
MEPEARIAQQPVEMIRQGATSPTGYSNPERPVLHYFRVPARVCADHGTAGKLVFDERVRQPLGVRSQETHVVLRKSSPDILAGPRESDAIRDTS